MRISKMFKFSSPHNYIDYNGKCEKLHGHTYKLKVTIEGKQKDDGIIFDFNDIMRVVDAKVIDVLDHNYINDFIKQPTAENIAKWVWVQLNNQFGKEKLVEIQVYEGDENIVTYDGNDE